jgi:hypothetical protein
MVLTFSHSGVKFIIEKIQEEMKESVNISIRRNEIISKNETIINEKLKKEAS